MKPSSVYLLLYNAVQVFGWSVILVKTILALCSGASPQTVYKAVVWELEIFQTAAILEIVHSGSGLVRSPMFTTFAQVFSRIMITWPVTHAVNSAQSSVGVPLFLLAWSITEVVRYSFYGFSILGAVPRLIQWLRYTLFIVLYPLGVLGELLTVFAALPEVKRTRLFSIAMPNRANMSFDYYSALIFFTFFYLPGFPQLYGYMFAQRRKVLGTKSKNA